MEKPNDFPSLEQLEQERERLYRRRRSRRRWGRLFNRVTLLLALFLLAERLILPVLIVQGASMEPTLQPGDAALCVRGSSYDRDDIVAFNYSGKTMIKRAVGAPGDVIDIDAEGYVYRNGERLSEPYVKVLAAGTPSTVLPCTVPEGCWFLLGDNRSVSVDSRSVLVGCVSEEQILGRVSMRVWPLNSAGTIRKPDR